MAFAGTGVLDETVLDLASFTGIQGFAVLQSGLRDRMLAVYGSAI